MATKKASKKTSKKKAPARKATKSKATKKVASKKTISKRARATSSKKVSKAKTSTTKQAQAQGASSPNTTPCYKVVVERTKGKKKLLQSIMAKGALRLTYSDKLVNAPHPDLPITAFRDRRDAQRFIDRNRVKRQRRGLKNPWLLVVGEGVISSSTPLSRVTQIGEVKTSSKSRKVAKAVVSQITSITSTQPPPRRIRNNSNWRQQFLGRNWSLGTIFLDNFRISTSLP